MTETATLGAQAALDTGRAPSFVDLDAFVAQAAELAPANAANPWLDARVALTTQGTPGPIAALFLPQGEGRVEASPADEFVAVLEGEVTLVDAAGTHSLAAGQSAVVPHGCAFAWMASGPVRAITLRYPASVAAGRTITPILADPEMLPSGKPAAELLLGPAPECRNHNDYRVDEGRFVCGTWDSTGYVRKGFRYQHDEIMAIKQGSVTFTDEFGNSGTFAKGSTVLAQAGSHCAWDSREDVTKVFAILRV